MCVICATLSYSMFLIYDGESELLFLVGSFITISCSAILSFGVEYGDRGEAINLRIVSGVFLSVFILINLGFALIDFEAPWFVITHVTLITLQAVAFRLISKAV